MIVFDSFCLFLVRHVDCPDPVKKLISSCWRRNPRERPSSHDVLRRLEVISRQCKGNGSG